MVKFSIPVAYEKLYNTYRERHGKEIVFQMKNPNGTVPILYKTRCVPSQADFSPYQDGDTEAKRTVRIPVGILNQLKSVDLLYSFPKYSNIKKDSIRVVVDNEFFVVSDVWFNTFSNLVIIDLVKGG